MGKVLPVSAKWTNAKDRHTLQQSRIHLTPGGHTPNLTPALFHFHTHTALKHSWHIISNTPTPLSPTVLISLAGTKTHTVSHSHRRPPEDPAESHTWDFPSLGPLSFITYIYSWLWITSIIHSQIQSCWSLTRRLALCRPIWLLALCEKECDWAGRRRDRWKMSQSSLC